MRQKTVKTAVEALLWMDRTPHHWASAEEEGFFVVGNRDEKLRIPVKVLATMDGLYGPGGEMDARMFRPTEAGRRMIGMAAAGVRIDIDAKTGGRFVFVTGGVRTGKTRFIQGEIARQEAAGIHCVHWREGMRVDDLSDRRNLREVAADAAVKKVYVEQTRG